MNVNSQPRLWRARKHTSQRGVVLVMTLICLALMLVAAVALTRSTTNSLLQAGNYAFKQDLLNQAERGFANAIYTLNSGGLASESTRQASAFSTYNYSATRLDTNGQGIPLVLINDTTASNAGIVSSNDITDTDAQVSIRTVIDRQCTSAGAFSNTSCNMQTSTPNLTGTARLKQIMADGKAIYRITVRVDGPRNTQAFQQMMVSLP
jgi:type IV pilus assembly protein PilX